ncbi:MAG: CoA transferase [Burkholderiaceae bacterium]
MTGPLSGVRVIDLTTMVSGPLCTMTLADQGADVVKVESPGGGDYSRQVATRRGGFSASFLNNNRNKRSIVLDLKQTSAREVLRSMVREADVFIQNFRPGVAERMGLGHEALRAIEPRLVYVSIAGFGFDGPFADRPVFDPLVQALSGLTTIQGGSDDERPRLVRTILPDKLTAIQASQAICAALFARERQGQGQHVRLSMLDTLVAFLWRSDMGGHTFVGDELGAETAQSFIDLIYETADGYISVALMQDKHWRGFARVMDRPELLDDPRFLTPALRETNKDARTRLTQQILLPTRRDQVLALLEAADIPCAPVLTRTEMREHPQIVANGILEQWDHPVAGPLRQARQPARFSAHPAVPTRGAPALGEHTVEILSQAGLGSGEIDAMLASGAAQGPVAATPGAADA